MVCLNPSIFSYSKDYEWFDNLKFLGNEMMSCYPLPQDKRERKPDKNLVAYHMSTCNSGILHISYYHDLELQ